MMMMMTMSDSIHFSVMKEVVFLKNNITLFLQVSTLFPFSFLLLLLLFFFWLATSHGLWDLSSPTRD